MSFGPPLAGGGHRHPTPPRGWHFRRVLLGYLTRECADALGHEPAPQELADWANHQRDDRGEDHRHEQHRQQVGATVGVGLLEGKGGVNWRLFLSVGCAWIATIAVTAAISGGLFAFITSLDEVVISSFISGGESTTLTKKIFSGLRDQVDQFNRELDALERQMLDRYYGGAQAA